MCCNIISLHMQKNGFVQDKRNEYKTRKAFNEQGM